MRPLNVSAIREFKRALHTLKVTQDGFKAPASTNTSAVANDRTNGAGCCQTAAETLGQQGDQRSGRQELADIDQRLLRADPGDSTSSALDSSQKVTAHADARKWRRLGFRRHPHFNEFRIHLEALQPKRCLPANRSVGTTQQQGCPCPLLERLEKRRRVVQPLRRPHHVALNNQALERLVTDSHQIGLLDRHETLLRSYQLPEFPRKILPSLHTRMIGLTAEPASRPHAACG